MSPDLKPIEEQVIVIAGASSGIGLTTARMAAERGARVVLAARSEETLEEVTEEINAEGGDAEYVVADVSDRDAVREIAATAEDAYGGFDTWVNVASGFLYGRLSETPVEDMRELFEVNVWGTLYGSLEAAEHLKSEDVRDGRGGAIVNIGSITSDRAILLQGAYSASKHAVKGFTDALRMELEEEGAPVSVTLVKPAAIDTPYPEHAKNYMDREATLPPPVYAPETVARTVLHAAESPERDLYVGGRGSKPMAMLEHYAPGTLDTVMEKLYTGLQQESQPAGPLEDNSLDGPSEDGSERGSYDGRVSERSLYTTVERSRVPTSVSLAAIGVLGAVIYAFTRSDDDGDGPIESFTPAERGSSEDAPLVDLGRFR